MKKLFGWLLGIFRRKLPPVEEERYDVYKPTERLIYRYWDGKEEHTADPLALYKKLMDVWPSLCIDMKVARSPLKDAPKAHDKALTQVRGVFGTQKMEEGGLSELETLQLLDHFLIYCEWIKKNSSMSAMPSTLSEDFPTTSEDAPPTSSSSVSGSTDTGASTEPPRPSPSVPESPSVPSTLA